MRDSCSAGENGDVNHSDCDVTCRSEELWLLLALCRYILVEEVP